MIIKNKTQRLVVSILIVFVLYFIITVYYFPHILLIEQLVATPFILLVTFPISFSIIKVLNDSFKEVKKNENNNETEIISEGFKNSTNKTKKINFFKVMLILGVVLVIIAALTLIYSGPISFSH